MPSEQAVIQNAADMWLLKQVQAGDAESLAALYQRYHGDASRIIRRLVTDRDGEDDVLQEAFISVWRSARTYQPEAGPVRPWLMQVIRSRAMDWHRTRRRQGRSVPLEEGELVSDGREVFATACQRVDQVALRQAVAMLPAQQRQVVRLTYLLGFTLQEVSSLLGVPLGTVKTRRKTALKRLRTILTSERPATAAG